MRLTSFISSCCIFLCVGCGAFDDISAMRKDVKETNQKMDKLASSVSEMAGSVNKVAGAMTETNSEIKKTNASLVQVTNGVTEMKDSVTSTNAKLETSLGYQKSMDSNTGGMTTFFEGVNKTLREVSAEIKALRGDISGRDGVSRKLESLEAKIGTLSSDQMFEKMNDMLEKFSYKVQDAKKANMDRAAAAITVYSLLDGIEIPSNLKPKDPKGGPITKSALYEAYLANKIETLKTNRENPNGIVASGVYIGGWPRRKPDPGSVTSTEKEAIDGNLFAGPLGIILHEWVGMESGLWMNGVKKVPEGMKNSFPLGAYTTNFVWALTLSPRTIEQIHTNLLGEASGSNFDKSHEFLRVSKKMHLETLSAYSSVESGGEERGKKLTTADFTEFQRRAGVILQIQQLPDFPNQPKFYSEQIDQHLRDFTQVLLDKTQERKETLSPQDKTILKTIRDQVISSPRA